MMPLTPFAWSLEVVFAGICALVALGLALALRAVHGRLMDCRGRTVAMAEAWLAGMRDLLEQRRVLSEQIAAKMSQVNPGQRERAERVARRVSEGLEALTEAVRRRIEGADPLAVIDPGVLCAEIRAGDETLGQLADLLTSSVALEEKRDLETALEEVKSASEATREKLQGHLAQLASEKRDLEQRVQTMVDPEEMARAKEQITVLEGGIEEIEQILTEPSGTEQSEAEAEERARALEEEISAIDAALVEAEEQVASAPDETSMRYTDQRLRLQRLKRGVLDRVVRQQRAEQQVTQLKTHVETLQTADLAEAMTGEEVQRIKESHAQFRQAMGESRSKLRAITERIKGLEAMEETSQRVRQELRNLGIINLELQRQVESLEQSQVLYERALRSLSKLNAELESRDRRIAELEGTIKRNELEIRRLQREIERLQGGAPAPAPGEVGVAERALASQDVGTLRSALQAKIHETMTLRGQVRTLEQEVTDKQSQIERLEDELDKLAGEYQKLFKEIPLRD